VTFGVYVTPLPVAAMSPYGIILTRPALQTMPVFVSIAIWLEKSAAFICTVSAGDMSRPLATQ
jgi:hypothetical protein